MTASRNSFLNAMKVKFPSLDVNQLYIDTNTIGIEEGNDTKSATVRVVTNSNVYYTGDAYEAVAFAGSTLATDVTYSQPTVTQTNNTSIPTYTYKETTITNDNADLQYSISPAVTPGVTSFGANGTVDAGKITLTPGVNFAGCLYTVTAAYTDAMGNVYTNHTQV
jgi:hypothetical protein